MTTLQPIPTIDDIVAQEVMAGGTNLRDVMAMRCTTEAAKVRERIVMRLVEERRMSFPEIARVFGRKSHSSFVELAKRGALRRAQQCK